VAAVLAEYPEETIRYVTDPRTGIPSRVDWMPTVGEVKRACEDHYGPTRRALEREAAERKVLEERRQLAITDGRPRKTYEELVADCRARGLMISGGKRSAVETIDAFLAEYGVTREQFDALPDLPKDIGVRR
jgi:tryptophanyl-tRNA synthetase